MVLTSSQLLLSIAFNEAKIRKQEAVALLSLLNEKEVEKTLDQLDKIVEDYQRFPTPQEIMEILWPILKDKGDKK